MMNSKLRFVIAFFSFAFLTSTAATAQTARYMTAEELRVPTHFERLGVDFEIKNMPNPDMTTLNGLDLSGIENHRLEAARSEYTDTATGWVIVVYSAEETTRKKTALLERTITPQNEGDK